MEHNKVENLKAWEKREAHKCYKIEKRSKKPHKNAIKRGNTKKKYS